jgi:hypothetical protein
MPYRHTLTLLIGDTPYRVELLYEAIPGLGPDRDDSPAGMREMDIYSGTVTTADHIDDAPLWLRDAIAADPHLNAELCRVADAVDARIEKENQ